MTLFAAGYLACQVYGNYAYIGDGRVAVIWPASGLLAATLIRAPLRWWPAVLAVAAGAQMISDILLHGRSVPLFLAFVVSNLLEGVIAAALYLRLNRRAPLGNLKAIVRFVGSALTAALVSAALGAPSVAAAHGAPATLTFVTWLLADLEGMFLVGPIVLGGTAHTPASPGPGRLELAAFLSLVGALAYFAIGPVLVPRGGPVPEILIAVIVWGGLRFELRWVAVANLIIACVAVIGLKHGHGHFARSFPGPMHLPVWALQGYVTALGLSGLAICAVTWERRLAIQALQTHQQQLEGIVQRRTAELEFALDEIRSFAYSVSHDLQTPLRAIVGFAACLEREAAGRLGDRDRDHLQRLRAAGERMERMIQDMLQLCHVAGAELRHQRVDLTAMARQILAELQAESPERRVRTVVRDGLEATGDEGLLRIALENLLGNAWKFTGRTEEARIEVGGETAADRTELFVRDNGTGFDMRHADRLFVPFRRLHAPAEFPGTGVGLATVQRVLVRHGGDVTAEARPGRGATFRVTLPRRADREPCPQGQLTAPGTLAGSAYHSPSDP